MGFMMKKILARIGVIGKRRRLGLEGGVVEK